MKPVIIPFKTIVALSFLCLVFRLSYGQGFFSQAVPVWVSDRQVEQNLTASFRTVVQWDGQADVLFRITAHSGYRAHVNGVFLGHGPCVAGIGFFRVDEYDLRNALKPGENIIAIEAAGYNIDNYYIPNQPSFLQAEVTSGGIVLAATLTHIKDKTSGTKLFEAALQGQRVQDVPKYSFQRPYLESYALSPGYRDWMTDTGVRFAAVALEQTDRKELIPRRVRYPDYSVRKFTESLPGNIYKFECNSTGFIGARAEVTTPSRVVLTWDEILLDGKVDIRRLGCNSSITYDLQPGSYNLESFEPYTLQYLQVKVEQGDCRVSDFYIRQYVNSDVSRSSFSCNDPKLNRIYRAAVETYKQNALDIFMDCPSRERAGWLCDSYFTACVAFDLSGNTLVETNFLENYLLPAKFRYIPDGMLPMCYPSDHSNGNFLPNWAMWFILELEEYQQRSGDVQMVRKLEPKVMALLDYFSRYENEDGLLEGLEKWIFVEWSKANSFVQDVNYPTNMLYAKALEVAAGLYRQPALKEKSQQVHRKIREQSFDGTFFMDHAIRENGRLVPRKDDCTETCQYYAFFLGTATPESHPGLWKILLNDFGPQRKETKAYSRIYPSNAFIGNYLRLEVLSRYGHVRQLLKESIDEYFYMADLTGTLWENTTTVASCNHGFASHVAHVFYRDLLGISRVDIQNKQLDIVFNESDVKNCEGTVPAGDQDISLSWEKKGKKLIYKLIVPADYQVNVKNNTSMTLVKNK